MLEYKVGNRVYKYIIFITEKFENDEQGACLSEDKNPQLGPKSGPNMWALVDWAQKVATF